MVLNKQTKKVAINCGADKFDIDIDAFKAETKYVLRQITMLEYLEKNLLNEGKSKTISQLLMERILNDQKQDEEMILEKIKTFYHGKNPLD